MNRKKVPLCNTPRVVVGRQSPGHLLEAMAADSFDASRSTREVGE